MDRMFPRDSNIELKQYSCGVFISLTASHKFVLKPARLHILIDI